MTEKFGDLKILEDKYNVSYQYDQYKRAYIIYLIQHGKRSGPVRIVDVHRMEREQALAKLEAATKDHVMKYDHRVSKDEEMSTYVPPRDDKLDAICKEYNCSIKYESSYRNQYHISLKDASHYKMYIDFYAVCNAECDPWEYLGIHAKQLRNKYDGDMKNYGDYFTSFEASEEDSAIIVNGDIKKTDGYDQSTFIQLGEMLPQFEASEKDKQKLRDGYIRDAYLRDAEAYKRLQNGNQKSAEVDIKKTRGYDQSIFGGPNPCGEIVAPEKKEYTPPTMAMPEPFSSHKWFRLSPMPAPKCTSCNDTGIVDSYMYGQYECTACDMTKAPKKEKELSAWDKKLKEELDRGDDIWGSIAKKYKK